MPHPVSLHSLLSVVLALCALLLMSGCAAVSVSSVSPSNYLTERRGDVLTTGRLSTSAQEVLRVVGIEDCREHAAACREALAGTAGLTEEQRQSALAELWLEAALAADTRPAPDKAASQQDLGLDAWLETARHAWAYLFFTERSPGERAFEERQTQVRDYYNYAVQQTMTRLFHSYSQQQSQPDVVTLAQPAGLQVEGWQFSSHIEGMVMPSNMPMPRELLTASSLRFTGLRNTYRRDGFGAPLVAVLPPTATDAAQAPFAETRYPALTALLAFDGATLSDVLRTRRVQVRLYNPYRSQQVDMGRGQVPLAANFTAGYGLWLARSGFAVQALQTLFGRSDGIVRPQVQLMQPYDPDRGIVVMLHGLASSPEAWVNVANEILGDELLRQHYQVWQVYYPTNAPIPLNRHAIEQALEQTLAHFDPNGTARASRNIVLVGHSMGGVLARLLVSDSGDQMWSLLPPDRASPDPKLRSELAAYLEFHPLRQVTRVIFIAAPHRGTPFAENRLSRRIANLVTLPLAMLDQASDLISRLTQLAPTSAKAQPLRIPNSIDNLSDRDPFVRAAARLPISSDVRYHSIIGREHAEGPLSSSSDGIVPYSSAHLDGALSEKVIVSGHSVQETPQAVLEIRRILREHLSQ